MARRTIRSYAHKGIGIYQLITGGFGALFVSYNMIAGSSVSIVMLLFLSGYVMIAAAGYQLWKRSTTGELLTIVAQLLQLVKIQTGRFAYHLVTGLTIWIGWADGSLDAGSAVSTTFRYMHASGFDAQAPADDLVFQINLVALVIIGLVLYVRK